jgi:hypothetical protein
MSFRAGQYAFKLVLQNLSTTSKLLDSQRVEIPAMASICYIVSTETATVTSHPSDFLGHSRRQPQANICHTITDVVFPKLLVYINPDTPYVDLSLAQARSATAQRIPCTVASRGDHLGCKY